MSLFSCLLLWTLWAACSHGAMDECIDDSNRPHRCMPEFVNAAFNVTVVATNTCGSPPEEYCVQTGVTGVTKSCHICDAGDPRHHHSAVYLTDYNNQADTTWWQSQTMLAGIQYPNSINLTLHLGKSFDITYVRLKFHTSRPESFAIYKRTSEDGPWIPYQYYSGSCEKTYSKINRGFIRTGEDEQQALCTDEFSDISPLTGGNVAFSTLEGRPSKYNFDNSPVLQDWVTATDIRVALNRLNTFGDEVFNDPKVLKSYYYAISDFAVGGRCKCNGHASECVKNERSKLVCNCKHNTEGPDCNVCKPFYNDRPWRRATADNANECLPCNCNGKSGECYFDSELYRATGHGGHCRNCADNTDGPNCERCLDNYYRDPSGQRCLSCSCNPVGSLSTQCDNTGRCSCKPGVTGDKCDRCQPGYHTLTAAGCRPCSCNPAGSTQECDVQTGRCQCKENVDGFNCDRCKLGYFNLDPQNPQGCTPCFCFQHSTVCESADGYHIHKITSTFDRGGYWSNRLGCFLVEKFLGNQLLSYGQNLTLNFRIQRHDARLSAEDIVLEGAGHRVAVPLIAQGAGYLDNVSLVTARRGPGTPARWVEKCTCPQGYLGQHCEQCDLGYRRSQPELGLFSSCEPCICNGHSDTCDSVTGMCNCQHNTTGMSCERCKDGFYGDSTVGSSSDCKPCPCPAGATCAVVPRTKEVVCTNCPTGTTGKRCELCDDGFFGDPLGENGPIRACRACSCNNNIDPNAVGNCNRETGECLKCIYNTTGVFCDRCKEGFYGDARAANVTDKCKPCSCSPYGTVDGKTTCSQVTGQCQCLPYVINRDCSACEPGFYNLQSGKGCERCNCNSIGSTNGQCDIASGQCECQPGVTGQHCERCEVNFFGFSSSGCKPCDCDPEGSESAQCKDDGRCQCLPGFVGARCDMCEENYFYNRSTPGCQQCPNCYSLVRDKVRDLDKGLLDRLNNINKTLNNQWNRLQNIKNTVDNTGTQADRARNRVREAEDLISTAREELDKAKEAISKVVRFLLHRQESNIDKVDLSKLNQIDSALKDAKDKMAGSELDRKLKELNDIAKSQEDMIGDYERQIREIRADITNLNDIKNTLPEEASS
uniref:Laminin, gamma 1 n=1 Tax=Cyprinus carpio TaxID=7962 RepID=A0A8C1KJY5_CYPCA